jgi:hypothetical protein
MIWKVVLTETGEVRVCHHSAVTLRDMVLGGADEIREARRIKDEYVARKKAEEEADKAQEELWK